jgi:hypothetical protein
VGLDKDLAGTKVPQGKAPDIGAMELVPEAHAAGGEEGATK